MVTLPTLPFTEEQCFSGNRGGGGGGTVINRSVALLTSEEQGWARGVSQSSLRATRMWG